MRSSETCVRVRVRVRAKDRVRVRVTVGDVDTASVKFFSNEPGRGWDDER